MITLSDNLLIRLQNAEIVCKDCGTKYGKYSVGCSSTWMGECNVCEETKPVTEVRDYGYLAKGIYDEKEKIRKQSAEVANYMEAQKELACQEEDELPSYEQGDLTLKLTEEEVTALATLIDDVSDKYPPGQDVTFDSAFMKITELYEDYCVKYELSPAMKAYVEKYGSVPGESDNEKWEGFRDAYNLLNGGSNGI